MIARVFQTLSLIVRKERNFQCERYPRSFENAAAPLTLVSASFLRTYPTSGAVSCLVFVFFFVAQHVTAVTGALCTRKRARDSVEAARLNCLKKDYIFSRQMPLVVYSFDENGATW